ncbi:RepB-like protein, partial [Listeria monocytogenes]|nr:RepB-like protein [Listeria monocytogenes]
NSVDDNPEGNEEILFLRNLVSELQSEKKDLHKLLDQQQRLALQDKKLLEEYKEEIKELKSLMVPVRKDDKDPMVRKSKDIDNTKEELHTKNKKWWHFGRNVK